MITPPADGQSSFGMIEPVDRLPCLIIKRALRSTVILDTMSSQYAPASGLKPTCITGEERPVIFLPGFLHVLHQVLQFLRNPFFSLNNGGMQSGILAHEA